MTNKKLYPHLYEYRRLGEMATHEGEMYYRKNNIIISHEHGEEYKVNYERASLFGGLKYINRIHLVEYV
jgi:hypothetical protein